MRAIHPWPHESCLALPLRVVLLVLTLGAVTGAGERPLLEELVAAATDSHPMIRAARRRQAEVAAHADAVQGFYDPYLRAHARLDDESRAVPDVPWGGGGGADGLEIAAGVERAVASGAYLGMGAAERFRQNAGDDGGDLFQTLVGAQIRVPLNRDADHRLFHLAELRAAHQEGGAAARVLSVRRLLRHQVESAYVNLLYAEAVWRARHQATTRVRTFLAEAKERVEFKVIPEYQLANAEMEVALHAEEEANARQACRDSLLEIERLSGLPMDFEPPAEDNGLRHLADFANRLPAATPEAVYRQNGSWREHMAALRAAETEIDMAREDTRADLDFILGVTVQGERATHPVGSGTELSDHAAGLSARLTYSRPLGFTTQTARLRAAAERREALLEQLRLVERNIRTDLGLARRRHEAARARMQLAADALDSARETLDKERERFKTGDGRSRNVLDAQKDLSEVVLRQDRAAAALLRAWADYRYTAGYPETDTAAPTHHSHSEVPQP